MKSTSDSAYILKMRQAGISNHIIALKMGMTEQQVEERLKQMEIEAVVAMGDRMTGLVIQFNVLAHQYQLVGESLKQFAAALSRNVSIAEIEQVLKGDPATAAQRLITSFHVIHPWEPVNPEESIQKTLLGN